MFGAVAGVAISLAQKTPTIDNVEDALSIGDECFHREVDCAIAYGLLKRIEAILAVEQFSHRPSAVKVFHGSLR